MKELFGIPRKTTNSDWHLYRSEYQQAQLEKEIEELSWKVERAEQTDRADLENQMHIAG